MARKAKRTPAFLTFANLDFDKPTNLVLNKKDLTAVIKQAKDRALKGNDYTQRLFLESLLKRLPKLNVTEVGKMWSQINDFIGYLIVFPDDPASRIDSYLKYVNGILSSAKPILNYINKEERFSFDIMPAKAESTDILRFELAQDLAQFLSDHYYPGVFTRCKLPECDKFVIAKDFLYCCQAHSRKKYDDERAADSDSQAIMRAYSRLNKRYRTLKKTNPALCEKEYPNFDIYLRKKDPGFHRDLMAWRRDQKGRLKEATRLRRDPSWKYPKPSENLDRLSSKFIKNHLE